jgi:hypothetical protein
MKKLNTSSIAWLLISLIVSIYVVIALTSCTTVPTADHPSTVSASATPTPTPMPMPAATPTPAPESVPTLSWEKNHPDRAAWSKALWSEIDTRFDSFNKASDASAFCPKYASLTRSQKINVFAEMIVWTSYYECGWNPFDGSQDVGTANDKDTWSVGLLQMSVVDQVSYKMPFGYTYGDLQVPEKNLHLGLAIMARQIDRKGKILIPKGESGLYWAVLSPGGKYDKSESIKSHTKALSFCK